MEKPGYGDSDCGVAGKCPLIGHPELEIACEAMVRYTRLEIMAAEANFMEAAAYFEGKQNDLAIKLACLPGFYRI